MSKRTNDMPWTRSVATAVALVLALHGSPVRAETPTDRAAAPPARAETPARSLDLMAVWRTLLARPADTLPPAPPDNPTTAAKVELGRDLFRDVRLSGAGDRACASCHQPGRAFTDGRPRAAARDGGDLARNTPALYDQAWGKAHYWDGRAPSLEAQATVPITHPRELGGEWNAIVWRLSADPVMAQRFHWAFATVPPVHQPPIQPATIVAALAAYERTLMSPLTRFDRWIGGDATALDANEIAGFKLFAGRAGCIGCHSGWRFTDDRFHDIGLATDDPGRGAIAGGVPGLKAFKTPSLREARWTAPYMHDGSKPTLAAVIDHYAGGFVARPGLSSNMIRGLQLSAEERALLQAFLLTLSSPALPPEQ